MPVWAWILIGVAAALVVAGFAFVAVSRRRTGRLRQRFGPEYDRTIERRGDRRDAEADLAARERERDELTLRPLPAAARERYAESWRTVQAQFVDDPVAATRDADVLVTAVMRDRGYPMDDFERQAALVSVDHPDVVENYRRAHAISEATDRGEATTEDLRQALRHYRALFDELLEEGADEPLAAERAYTEDGAPERPTTEARR